MSNPQGVLGIQVVMGTHVANADLAGVAVLQRLDVGELIEVMELAR
jgi:hypothetical protein